MGPTKTGRDAEGRAAATRTSPIRNAGCARSCSVRVAREVQKQAHKADDSDPGTSGDEDDGADDHYNGLDDAGIAKIVQDIPPQRVQPPPPGWMSLL